MADPTEITQITQIPVRGPARGPFRGKVVVFTCNWNAYSGLEAAGVDQLEYPASVYPLKVMCLGQISPGIILKALEMRADGVLLLSCPPGECHYQFGNRRAEELFKQAREMATLLGYGDEQLKMDWVAAGDGQAFAEKVRAFVLGLNEKRE
ncbi:MAG: hydrogenase iron-sulfur subunit [Anaerolineae bacterium]|nr:hydrogenase iron-sulfur subunit [Anaerolineae bacterium]